MSALTRTPGWGGGQLDEGDGQVKLPLAALPLDEALVGRDNELARLWRVIETGVTALVLWGGGGVGKTHLACQLARQWATSLGLEVVSIPMAWSSTRAQILSQITVSLNIPLNRKQPPAAQIVSALKRKPRLLLLDDLQLGDATAFVAELHDAMPNLPIIVTCDGEVGFEESYELNLMGLLRAEEPTQCPCSTLLKASLDRHGVSVEPGPSLTFLLEFSRGLPLGLRLMGAALAEVPIHDYCRRVSKGLGAGVGPEAHLRRLIWANMDCLNDQTREALRQLSVFRGAFDEEAAVAVAQAGPGDLSRCGALGLVEALPDGRHRLPGAVRRVVEAEMAMNARSTPPVYGRHSRHYSLYLWERERHLASSMEEETLREIDAELADIRVAWRYAVEGGFHGEVRAALEPLRRYFEHRALPDEAGELLDMWLARWGTHSLGDAPYRRALAGLTGRVLWRRGLFQWRSGETVAAREKAIKALELLEATEQDREAAAAAGALGLIEMGCGEYAQARVYLERSVGGLSATSESYGVAVALGRLGHLDHQQGRLEAAERAFSRAVGQLQSVGATRGLPALLIAWGTMEVDWGRYDSSHAHLMEGLALATAREDAWLMASARMGLGRLETHRGHFTQAELQLDAATLLYRQRGQSWSLAQILSYRAHLAMFCKTPQNARRLAARAQTAAAEGGEVRLAAWATCMLGWAHACSGDYAQGRRLFEEAAEAGRSMGMGLLQAVALIESGHMELDACEAALARAHFADGHTRAQRAGHRWLMAEALEGMGRLALSQGQVEQAQGALIEAFAIADELGSVSRQLGALAALGGLWRSEGREGDGLGVLAFCAAHPCAEWRTQKRARAALSGQPDHRAYVHRSFDEWVALARG